MDQPIVFELGSYRTKYGFGGDDSPLYETPSIIGNPKFNFSLFIGHQKDNYVTRFQPNIV